MQSTIKIRKIKKYFAIGIYYIKLISPLLCIILLCSFQPGKKYIIYYGKNSSAVERATCEDLKNDLKEATHANVMVKVEPEDIAPSGDYRILVGSRASNRLMDLLAKKDLINISSIQPGPQGGLIQVINNGKQKILLLAGSDAEGAQNAVYDFCSKDFGIDPLSYWTGYKPAVRKNYNPYNTSARIVDPPVVPTICYFENDVDELANLHKPYLEYDMETWKGMVNSLRRIHYNAIQLFDMLGRAEFFTREPYKKLRPNYHTNLKLVDSLIDYAHLKGMKIQIDLSPGYEMKSLTDSEAVCWTQYKQKWIDTWVYYLTKTPLGKADIFSLRPRNQVWDRAYVSSCGENKTEVFNEVYAALDSVLDIYKPDAQKLCICYDDGMEMFNHGFNPPKDFTVVWSDDGYGDFNSLPASTKGYHFGTYMHAGFWKNHTVHDPYPEKIDSVLSYMLKRYNAKSYIDVNGQTFRPFLLNLEAFGDWAYDPHAFNGERFYHAWAVNYFGKVCAPFAMSSMKALHRAQFARNGYVENLSEIKRLIGFLQGGKGINNQIMSDFINKISSDLVKRSSLVETAVEEASLGLPKAKDQADFYFDYIYLPALMYHELLDFENTLLVAAHLKWDYITGGHEKGKLVAAKKLMLNASVQLKLIYKTSLQGDKNRKWATWYDPVKRRPNNGFPTPHMITSIEQNLDRLEKLNNRQRRQERTERSCR
ncbi:hypothetical protein FW778_03900 [Ginsengibacter hankyongi]|uniref:Uncharacterized protein n=1 Tax=Ginsengibacter hankyongi TaxID=2607284 RepID=A0A5J5IKW1_9BACT|nr:glycosyl hydrolase 115 family protein [Ginsengibacter hankyongi]KAA9041188.1 hypothetical protein FW778_03900 [Ginsengibacter hankyongi]